MYRSAYGRHGPDAWKKKHQDRSTSSKHPLTVVVFLCVPATTERMVLVLNSETDPTSASIFANTLDGTRSFSLSATPSPAPVHTSPLSLTPSQQLDPLDQVRSEAFSFGLDAGGKDRNAEREISLSDLEDSATRRFNIYIQANSNLARAHDSAELYDAFSERYQMGYLKGSKRQLQDFLPDWESTIHKQAYQDKARDEQTGDALDDDSLLVRALERAMDSIGIHTQERKQEVTKNMSVYLKAYRKYKPKGGSFRATDETEAY